MQFVRRLRLTSTRPRALVAVTVAVMLGALIGLAGAGAKLSSGGVVQACVAKTGGAVRFVKPNHRCAKTEASLLLNQKGQPGKKGKIGKTGPIGNIGATGPAGPTGPSGPADTEVVNGPVITLSGGEPAGATAISTAGCDQAVNGANREAYGGGVNVVTHPQTQVGDVVSVQSSYAGNGATGPNAATQPGAGQRGNAWTGVAVINRLYDTPNAPDTATVQAYVVCGP